MADTKRGKEGLPPIPSKGFATQTGEKFSSSPSEADPNSGRSKKETRASGRSSRVSKAKTTQLLSGKSLKFLKAKLKAENEPWQRPNPEEEKLKILPECCDLTDRKKGQYKDESRQEMDVVWFSDLKITKAQQKQLCFSESLLIVEETGNVVGKMYCSVTFSKWMDKQCFCVHAGSFAKFSTGLETGTSITSFVNFNLTTQQEFVHEWATQGTDTIERKTFVMNEWNTIACKITLMRNATLVDGKNINLAFRERENLVLEGANLILQRLLILERRTIGSMTLQALSYTGKVVKAKYEELGSGWENVKGKQVKTWGIRRTTKISDDEERTWDCLFNKNARLMLRCQPDAPQALIPLWFESIEEFDKNGNFIGSYSPYAWACDMELYTKYSLKKEESCHDHRRYIIDHPDVRALLSDYLQALLFRKPRNVVEFTQQYFESFLNLKMKGRKSTHNLKGSVSRTSGYYYGSTLSYEDFGEDGGEWFGEWDESEGSDNSSDYNKYYQIPPKASFHGLQKISQNNKNNAGTESDRAPSGNTTEDDPIELKKYIRETP